MGDITSANASIVLSIPALFSTPQTLQGFATDDVFDIPAIESVETLMGVDGVLSAGFVFKEIPLEITLQGDSASNAVFDRWWTQMVATLVSYAANGVIRLPGIQTKWNMTSGYLTSYKPAPQAKKILQPRRFQIRFNQIAPAPA